MLDIYTYLFQSKKVKTVVDFQDLKLFIKTDKPTKKDIKEDISNKNVLVYEIYDYARIEYNMDNYYGYTTIFSAKKLDKILALIDVINKFHQINYNILESKIDFHGVDLVTVYILNNITIPYIDHKYSFIQSNIPFNDIELLKSNSYYYSKYVNEIKDNIVDMTMPKFIKFLKKVYGDKFDKKDYLREVESLEKFKMKLPKFMKEKARLPGFDEPEDAKGCFDFFYHKMRLILDDLHIRPGHFIKFY